MNGICPRCEGQEDSRHDCICQSWAILVVEEDNLDDEGILIVFNGQTKRKKDDQTEIEHSGRGASISGDDKAIFGEVKVDLVETIHSDEYWVDSNEVGPFESTHLLNLHVFQPKEMKASKVE